MQDWQNLNCGMLIVEGAADVAVDGAEGGGAIEIVAVAEVEGGGGAGLAASETLADAGGGVADFRRAAGDTRD